jgi:hypothetical protein
MTTLQKQMDKLRQKISKLCIELEDLKGQCTHPDLIGEYGANTGNYDPSCDKYWVQFYCPCCGERWREDQDAQKYCGGKKTSKRGFIWKEKQ